MKARGFHRQGQNLPATELVKLDVVVDDAPMVMAPPVIVPSTVMPVVALGLAGQQRLGGEALSVTLVVQVLPP